MKTMGNAKTSMSKGSFKLRLRATSQTHQEYSSGPMSQKHLFLETRSAGADGCLETGIEFPESDAKPLRSTPSETDRPIRLVIGLASFPSEPRQIHRNAPVYTLLSLDFNRFFLCSSLQHTLLSV